MPQPNDLRSSLLARRGTTSGIPRRPANPSVFYPTRLHPQLAAEIIVVNH